MSQINMGSNESPLGPSPKAVIAMQEAAISLNRYPDMFDANLRSAIAESLGDRVGPDHIVTGNGACDVLSLYAYAFLSPDSECIISRPTFPVYELTARRQGATVVFVDLEPDTFECNVDALLAAVTERTSCLYLCSPNNPTGSVVSQSQFQRLVSTLPDHVLLVVDEVYHHFVTAERKVDFLRHIVDAGNMMVLHSFSKAYGLAGSRLGYGVGPKSVVADIAKYRLPFHINNVTIQGALVALSDTEHLDQTVSAVRSGREFLSEQLSQLGVAHWPSEANFILFRTSHAASAIADELASRGVTVRPMEGFYLPDYVRVSVGLESENAAFIRSLRETLETLSRA